LPSHDPHIRRILDQFETGRPVSQRSLSGELGIALGLTNLLVRRMMRKGWVQLVRVPPNRYHYFLTPAGLAEKARRTRAYLAGSVQFYVQARDRIRQVFDATSAGWGGIGGPKDIVFFRAGEIAEIGYVCLHDSDLRLVGVVDDRRNGSFFGVPVHPVEVLDRAQVAGQQFGALVVMSFSDTVQARAILAGRNVPSERIVWLA
jgi:DNA-binding MarR family transcriptional regulator